MANHNQLDYGRVILYFLCYYFRKAQIDYPEQQYNPLLIVFKDQCNKVISGVKASYTLKLKNLELTFQGQDLGFNLTMNFADEKQSLTYWQILSGMKDFSALDIADFLDEDPTSKEFLFALLVSQSPSRLVGNMISIDLPDYQEFVKEVLRWKNPRQPQTQ